MTPKPRSKPSPELQEKMAAVQAAASGLRDNHHLAWIVNAAAEHFADSIGEAEREIARHERFIEEPYLGRFASDKKTRQERIDDKKASIEQYRAILRFLHACDDMISLASAETFAQELFRTSTASRLPFGST